MRKSLFVSLYTLLIVPVFAQGPDYLAESWKKTCNGVQNNYLAFQFQERRGELDKNFKPWQPSSYKSAGQTWFNHDHFMKLDSVMTGHRNHVMKLQFDLNDLLWQKFEGKNLTPVPQSLKDEYLLQTARYTPALLLDYLKGKKLSPEKESTNYYALYKTTYNKIPVSVYVRKSDSLVYQITWLQDHELYGDVLTTVNYDQFQQAAGVQYPAKIAIHKYNGHVTDEVTITQASASGTPAALLTKPTTYSYLPEPHIKSDIQVEKYADHIYFVNLKHMDDKAMIVEFSNYLLIADVPPHAAAEVIAEAKKIAPSKPISYFAFGHHHEHYIGGLRDMIHAGAKVICNHENREYVQTIAQAPHTLNPDALQKEPHTAVLDTMTDKPKIIGDGSMEMRILMLGSKSQHTLDYMVYYFPAQKLLVENDLTWIPREGNPGKANVREAGLYNAIKEWKLDVKDIIQNTPSNSRIAKSILTMEDLEKAMHAK